MKHIIKQWLRLFLVPINMIASNYFKKKSYDICLLSLFYFGAQKKMIAPL
jgi:hypothetical protein